MKAFDLGPWLDLLVSGLWVTVYATILGTALAVLVAFALGMLSLEHHAVPRTIARIIVEFFRGTSLIVQLFWIVYAAPLLLGYKLNNVVAAIIALGLNFGAYGAEVVRGAIKAVPKPQREACTALNLTALHSFRRVILPQALPLMIPPAGNLTVQLIKSTPLMFLVGTVDLFTVGDMIRQGQPGSVALVYLGVLVVFFLLSMAVVAITQLLENWAKRRLGQKPVRISTATVAGAAPAGEVV
jgi:polar amino acid transport system permease protein